MSTLRVNNLTNQANDGGIEFAVQPVIDGLCKAWVNFNGTGTVAIRASYNVSSITDNGTGNYTVNFTNAMVDTNYSTSVVNTYTYTGTMWHGVIRQAIEFYDLRTTTSCRVGTAYSYSAGDLDEDSPQVCVSIFR